MIRRPERPLLTRDDIPDMPPEIRDATSVFNPGAVLVDGTTHLLLRVQTRGRRTFLVPAHDGRVAPRPTVLRGLDAGTVFHVYDPRVTRLDHRLLVVTALDTDRGGRLALWEATGDRAAGWAGLDRLDFIALTGDHDTRNGVLFPRQVGGRYLLLERPNRIPVAGGPPTGDAVELLASDDLVTWQAVGPVFGGRPRFWDELVGPGPPPVLTDNGWLLVYHGVATHFGSANIYQAGCLLLDRDDPTRVRARCRDNILEPRRNWELAGQVPNVVFPSGMTMQADGAVRIYYGAADTCVGCAQTTIDALLAACGGEGADS